MKLGFDEIMKIGNEMSEQMTKLKLKNNTLVIEVDKKTLMKIDEDLYYRQNGDETKYIPSKKEINVTFKNFNIKIKTY